MLLAFYRRLTAQEAIQKNPELVRSGKCEVASTLTPLNCAAAQGHVPCLEALLEAGAPLEAEDGFGQTALQVLPTPGNGKILYFVNTLSVTTFRHCCLSLHSQADHLEHGCVLE